MSSRYLTVIAIITALSILSGCAPTRLERNWGVSYEAQKENQIENPDAEMNLEPVEGLDGQAAVHTMDNYRKGFTKKGKKKGKSCGSGTGLWIGTVSSSSD